MVAEENAVRWRIELGRGYSTQELVPHCGVGHCFEVFHSICYPHFFAKNEGRGEFLGMFFAGSLFLGWKRGLLGVVGEGGDGVGRVSL